MTNDAYLVVVSGPAGTGKDTVVQRLIELYPEIQLSVSATSRPIRGNEKEGVNYYYLTRQQFEQKIQQGELLEYAEYCNNYYGTLKQQVDSRIQKGITVILVIEVVGAASIKRIYPDCTTVFVQPPDYATLEKRLRGRGTECEQAVQSRLERAVQEMEYAANYDEVVVNEVVDDCANELYAIIQKRQKQMR